MAIIRWLTLILGWNALITGETSIEQNQMDDNFHFFIKTFFWLTLTNLCKIGVLFAFHKEIHLYTCAFDRYWSLEPLFFMQITSSSF